MARKSKIFDKIYPEQFGENELHQTSIIIRIRDFIKIKKQYGSLRNFIEKKLEE